MISGSIGTSNPGLMPPGGPAPAPGAVPWPLPPPLGGNAAGAKKAAEAAAAAAAGPAKEGFSPIGALVPTMVGPGGVAVPPTGTPGAGPAPA